MRRSKWIARVWCLLIPALLLSACKFQPNEKTPETKVTLDSVVSGGTICDQFLDSIPPHGPNRIEAGKPCVEALPDLPAEDQLRILNHYAAQMDGYIPQDDIKPLIVKLDKDASLPLRAFAINFVLHSRSPGVDEELIALHEDALATGNRIAEAHVLYNKKIRPFMNSASPITDGDFEAALAITIEEEMRGFKPYVRNAIARLHRDKSEYPEAVESYKLALDEFAASKDYAGQANTYRNLSVLYSDFLDHEKALKYAQQGIAFLEQSENQDYHTLKNSYIQLARNLRSLRRYDEALEAVRMAMSPETGPPGTINTSVLDRALAIALYDVGRAQEAIAVLEQILIRSGLPSASDKALGIRADLAKQYLKWGNLDDAQRHLDALLAIADSENLDLAGMARRMRAERGKERFVQAMIPVLITFDREEDALEFLQIGKRLTEQRIEEESQKALASHTLQTALRERDESIERLGIEAANARLQLTASRLQSALAGLSALALAVIAFIAYRSFRTQSHLTAIKDTYLDEIHHRTKNNFQLLSSLLNMDIRRSGTVDKDEGRRLDAINRLQTMALVHDHIYSLDASKETTADLSEFIDDLLALMDTSLGRDDITLEWSVTSGHMDVTQLTPFGLMLCELVANSYKHAFSDRGGTITIDITEENGSRKMTLKDDGKGFDLEAAQNKPGSLGLSLIFDLADQVGGKLSVKSCANGTIWTFK